MSQIMDVIKNKNKVEKARRARRKDEMAILRSKSAFKAKLHSELQHIDLILDDPNVKSITITVPDRALSDFTSALYSNDLSGYDIKQVPDTANQFYIEKKYIAFS